MSRISFAEGDGNDIRYTDFHVTLNTNIKPRTQQDSLRLQFELRGAIRETLQDDEYMARLLGLQQDDYDDNVIRINIGQIGTERGEHPKGGRVHAHFVIEVTHRTTIDLTGVHKRWQGVFNEVLGHGTYVFIRLLGSSAAKNYALKDSRPADWPQSKYDWWGDPNRKFERGYVRYAGTRGFEDYIPGYAGGNF